MFDAYSYMGSDTVIYDVQFKKTAMAPNGTAMGSHGTSMAVP